MIALDVHQEVEQLLQQARQMITEHNRDAVVLINDAYSKAIANLDMRNAAFALLAKANYYSLVINDCSKAMQLVDEAKEIACTDDNSLMAHTDSCYGVIHHILGNTAIAQKHYQNAIQLLECTTERSEFDNERLPTLYYNNFILFSYTEDLLVDVSDLNMALESYQKSGNVRGEINCYTALANHYHNRLKDTDKALETINIAYQKAKQTGTPSLIGSACNNAGLYLADLGKFEDSLLYLNEAMDCFKEVNNPYLSGSVQHQTGIVYIRMQQYDKAIFHLLQAKQIYSDNGIKNEHDKLYELLAEAYFGSGMYKEAYEYEHIAKNQLLERSKNEKITVLAKERSKFENTLKDRETEILEQKNKEIEQYVVRLENSNNELKQFAHVASHDLKEPLRMIYSYMGLLKKSLGNQLNEQQEEFIGFAMDGARRMEQLIVDLLRLAKVDANPKVEKVAIAKVIEEIKLNFDSRLTEKNAVIDYKHVPVIQADRTQVLLLLQNLISNGLKYNQDNQPTVKISCRYHRENFELSVTDNGIGIPLAYRKKVFQIFQRLHRGEEQYEGTGIGLAICKKIVDGLGGQISITEPSENGTTFSIVLPNALLCL